MTRLVPPVLIAALWTFGLLASGCVSTVAYPAKRFFRLNIEPPRASISSAESAPQSLRIGRFRIARAFEGAELVYRTGESQYETDYYAEFIAAPDALLEDLTLRYLAAAGVGSVVSSSSLVPSDHVLEGVVSEMYGDYLNPDALRAHMELRFFLVHDDGLQLSVVREHVALIDEPIESEKPEALIAGWNRGLQRVLGELAVQLRSAR